MMWSKVVSTSGFVSLVLANYSLMTIACCTSHRVSPPASSSAFNDNDQQQSEREHQLTKSSNDRPLLSLATTNHANDHQPQTIDDPRTNNSPWRLYLRSNSNSKSSFYSKLTHYSAWSSHSTTDNPNLTSQPPIDADESAARPPVARYGARKWMPNDSSNNNHQHNHFKSPFAFNDNDNQLSQSTDHDENEWQLSNQLDIDECLDERACGRGATCENLPGSFRCSCPPGFTGDPSVECIGKYPPPLLLCFVSPLLSVAIDSSCWPESRVNSLPTRRIQSNRAAGGRAIVARSQLPGNEFVVIL